MKIGQDQVVSRPGIPLCDQADFQRAGDTMQMGVEQLVPLGSAVNFRPQGLLDQSVGGPTSLLFIDC